MSAESDLRDRVVASSLDLAFSGVTGPQSLLDVDTVQRIGNFYVNVLELGDWLNQSGMGRILRGFPGSEVVLPEDGCIA